MAAEVRVRLFALLLLRGARHVVWQIPDRVLATPAPRQPKPSQPGEQAKQTAQPIQPPVPLQWQARAQPQPDWSQ